LLRRLNPGVPIHGIFGGTRMASRLGGHALVGLDANHASRKTDRWNWQHGDLVLAEWYRRVGHEVPFDVLHLIEWDLLLLEPLDSLYARVPPQTVGLTALTPVSELEQEWTWLRRQESRHEWETLLDWARAQWGYDGVPQGCVAPGACFPRSFIEAYADVNPPSLCHDELRLPLFAQILGFPLADTGLRGAWNGSRDDEFFRFRDADVALSSIRAELAKPGGWRAFHPVRSRIGPEDVLRT
jgi:hypothetical protein